MRMSFLNIFAQSPFKPIQKHMVQTYACVCTLMLFVDSVLKQDWVGAEDNQKEIANLEGLADEIKQEIRLNLPNSLFMPVSRSDLLELITVQDYIANKAKDISGLMLGRKMAIPKELSLDFKHYVQSTLEVVKQAKKSVLELDELLETGFGGSEAEKVKEMILELDVMEKKTDKIQIAVRADLFAIENNLSPVDVMFLYQIIHKIGEIADLAQKVGHRLQLLLAK